MPTTHIMLRTAISTQRTVMCLRYMDKETGQRYRAQKTIDGRELSSKITRVKDW